MSDVKNVVITRSATYNTEGGGGGGGEGAASGGRRPTRRRKKLVVHAETEGGGEAAPQAILVEKDVPAVLAAASMATNLYSTPASASAHASAPASAPAPAAPTSDRPVQIVKKARRVQLVPKGAGAAASTAGGTKGRHRGTRRRKISIQPDSIKRRLTRANKIRKTVESMPADKLREVLVKKGLLKKGSKTPDALVRRIAAEAHILCASL